MKMVVFLTVSEYARRLFRDNSLRQNPPGTPCNRKDYMGTTVVDNMAD